MSWLEVDWDQERPGDGSLTTLWRSVEIEPLTGVPAAVEQYLTELRRVYVNGRAEYARFSISGDADFRWFAARRRWDEISFFPQFLRHPAVRAALPEVTAGARFGEAVEFRWESPLWLDGRLAQMLVSGGAYEKFSGHPTEAKRLGAQVCAALFEDRYLDVEVFHCWAPWSRWFFDIAWDSTVVVLDRRQAELSLLCATDTD